MYHAAITQVFNPISELVIPKGIPGKEAKVEIEIYPVIAEAKIEKCSISFMNCTNLFVLSTHQFILHIFKEIISCLIYIF